MMDWAAVASAIEVHMAELGLNQRELADRSGVALSIVKELRHNTVQRRRSGRTLEAISVALGLHPRYLSNVLVGKNPSATSAPSVGDLAHQLARIEERLNQLFDHLAAIDSKLGKFLGRPGPTTIGRPPIAQTHMA